MEHLLVGFPIHPMSLAVLPGRPAFRLPQWRQPSRSDDSRVPSFFDDSFGNLPKFLPLLIQLIPRQFPRFLTRDQREHQRTDGPQTQTDKQVFVVINFTSFENNNVESAFSA